VTVVYSRIDADGGLREPRLLQSPTAKRRRSVRSPIEPPCPANCKTAAQLVERLPSALTGRYGQMETRARREIVLHPATIEGPSLVFEQERTEGTSWAVDVCGF
jgi:hypothetical protein